MELSHPKKQAANVHFFEQIAKTIFHLVTVMFIQMNIRVFSRYFA